MSKIFKFISAISLIASFAFASVASAAVDATGGGIIPIARTAYMWQPGVTYNGGIPNRTTIYKTLSPSGGDDTAAINSALSSCPSGSVVQLTAGTFKITGDGLYFQTPNCTLRGAGPGALANGAGGTILLKADHATNLNFAVLYVTPGNTDFGSSINLAQDGLQGSYSVTVASNPGIQVGEFVLIDQNTTNDPNVYWGPAHEPAGGGSRRWFTRQDRSLNQIVEVTAVNGNTITFNTPLHITMRTAQQAQLTRWQSPFLKNVGVENLAVQYGRGGDYHGNISVNNCAYCWIKNVNASHNIGTGIGFYSTFRSELRDSYIHEGDDPYPGGGGYLTGLNYGASDNLFENNAIWGGNKVDVMRATGGGNVLAYNYMDDAYGGSYPQSPEAGINAGHYTTPHMELLEGNWSQNYKGDSYWGNSINITVFRNWFTGLRSANGFLKTYKDVQGNCTYLYGDYDGRTNVDVQAYSYNTNFVGNVLGMQGQQLLGYNSNGCFDSTQHGFVYENLANFTADNRYVAWSMGADQAHVNVNGNWAWVSTTYQTQLRNGNFDWISQKSPWLGIGGQGTANLVTPMTIPNSLYLSAKPAFFGANPWPWVDPVTGATYTLPAKYCFNNGQMPNCLLGNTTPTPPPAPTPTAALAASPASITTGQSSTLTWSSTNATSCTGTGFTASGISGSVSVSPTTNASYSITCTGAGGSATASATVSVSGGTTPPPTPTVTLSANPASITSGQSSTLTWSSTSATSCSGTGFTASGTSGSVSVSPTANANYSIMCTGAGGSANANASITVSQIVPPPTNAKFSAGDTIITTQAVAVRSTAGGTKLGSQQKNALGTVVGGPTVSGTNTWWKIDFGSGTDGWSAELYLTKYSAPFNIGNRIQTNTSGVSVRKTPAGTKLGTQPQSALGSIVGGPTSASGNVWWQVDYDTVPDGWTAEPYLAVSNTTPPPPPAPTPKPTVSLTASPASITDGDTSSLTWSSTNATSCTGTGFTASGTSGSTSVSPASNANYSITCTGAGGSTTATASVAVTPIVDPVLPTPTVTLSASPTSITAGQSSTLTWNSTDATSCTGTGFTASGTSGSVTVSPTTNTTYSITCSGAGGSANASAAVTVSAGSTPTPTVTLSASPTSITSGQSSTLTWSSTNATSCTGTGFTASGTSGSVSVSPTANANYSITCTGAGGSANANASVTVTAAAPPTGSTITAGETTNFAQDDCCNPNAIFAQDMTLAQSATIQSLSFYIRQANGGNMRLAIYDASGPGGNPGQLKAQTNSFAVMDNSWNTANVVTPVSLPAGKYWLAYQQSNGSISFSRTDSGNYYYASQSYGSFPSSFPAGASGNTHWSFYATLVTNVSMNTSSSQLAASSAAQLEQLKTVLIGLLDKISALSAH